MVQRPARTAELGSAAVQQRWEEQQEVLRRPGPREELIRTQVSAPFVLKSSDAFPLGGRLRHFISFWQRVSSNPRMISTVLGVKLPFTATPVQKRPMRQYQFNEHHTAEVRRELRWMLDQEIVKPVPIQEGQFVSPLFLATNTDLTKRPILNVNEINSDYLPKLHFKMETLAVVLPLINIWQ